MTGRKTTLIAALLTLPLLLGVSLFGGLMLLVVLNGFMAGQAERAVAVGVVCQGAAALLGTLLAGAAARLFASRLGWRPVLAVAAAVLLGLLAGVLLSILALIAAIPFAG